MFIQYHNPRSGYDCLYGGYISLNTNYVSNVVIPKLYFGTKKKTTTTKKKKRENRGHRAKVS